MRKSGFLHLLAILLSLAVLPATGRAQCTNCTLTTAGGDTVATFTSGNGTFTTPDGVTEIEYLVVAGGGGGGGIPQGGGAIGGAGGGGAGGMLTGTMTVTPGNTMSVTVGGGGAGGVGETSRGGNGGESSLGSLTAIGGGGGSSNGVNNDGRAGGSGGGGRINGDGGSGEPGQGNPGGDGDNGAGGGGGADGAGEDGSGGTNGNNGGDGGAGQASSITGSSVTYAAGGDGGDYDADGSRSAGADAVANTGNGGGGASGANGGQESGGGAGGSGIVVVRYESTSTVPAPVGEYRMDEPSWNGTDGEVENTTGSLPYGTAQGDATTESSSPTPSDTCGYGTFDGDGDYVSVDNLSDTLGGTATLAFWVRTSQTGSDTGWQAPGITGVEDSGGADDIFWGWIDASGRIGISVGNDYAGDQKSNTAINDGTWHHVVLTRDAGTGETHIYIDGSLEQVGSSGTGSIGTAFSSIGRIEDTADSPEYFSGDLDELRVYDEVIDESEVSYLMGLTHPCPSAGLLDYRMDESTWDGTPGEVTDSTANGLDGQSQGASTDDASRARPGSPGTCGYGVFGSGQYVEGPNDASINNADSVSVSLWLRMEPGEQVGSFQTILAYGESTIDTEGRFELYRFNGRLYFEIRTANRNTHSVSIDGSGVFDDTWHHVVATFEPGARELSLYVDGAFADSAGFNGNRDLNSTTGPLAVGARPGGANDIVGELDEVRLFGSTLSSSEVSDAYSRTRPCTGGGVDHFVLDHDNAGINCRAETVGLRAEDTSGSLVTDYTGSVELTTSTDNGDWSLDGGDGTLTDSMSDDGEATYTFAGSDGGEVTLLLANTHAETLNITADDGTAVDDDSEGDLTFRPWGFELTPDPIPDQIAGRPFDLTLTAVGEVPGETDCDVIQEYDGNQDLAFWFDYEDPGNGGEVVTIDGTTIEDAESDATDQTINFIDGTATVTADYRDAGEIQLHVKDDSGIGEPPAGSGDEIVVGGTNTFVVRPFGFHVDVPADTGATGPNATPAMARAGEAFDVAVTAVVFDPDDDDDPTDGGDGVPDPGADLSDNAATPNFGQEATPEDVVLTPTAADPVGGSNGSLSNATFDTFTAGTQEKNNLRWNEVGYVDLQANLVGNDYLGTGEDVTGVAETIGRFYPDRFRLSGTSLTDRATPGLACTGTSPFTYIGERFDTGFTLTAVATDAVGSNTTTNYEGAYAHLDSRGDLNLGAIDQDDVERTGSVQIENASIGWADGQGDISLQLKYTRDAPEGPYEPLRVGVAPEDPVDSITLDPDDVNLDVDGNNDHGQTGSVQLRFGRLLVENAGGSELANVNLPLRVEYWMGNTWSTNTLDDCTTFTLTDYVDLVNNDGDTAAGNETIPVGDGTTEILGGDLMIMGGRAAATFDAPDAGNTGWVELTVVLDGTAPSYDYLGTGPDADDNYDANPVGRATFGIYSGDDEWIHLRRTR